MSILANCPYQSFLLNSAYKGRVPEAKEQIIDMTFNGSGIGDTAQVLGISTDTVLEGLKVKKNRHSATTEIAAI